MLVKKPLTEYEIQANNFLAKHKIEFSAIAIGKDCPRYCEDKKHIHGYHYLVTFSKIQDFPIVLNNKKKTVSFDFWNSYVDTCRKANSFECANIVLPGAKYYTHIRKDLNALSAMPKAYDVLACLQKSDIGTFSDFCADFGYDTDSRKAFETYMAVQEEWQKVRTFFTAEELEEMQEIQ